MNAIDSRELYHPGLTASPVDQSHCQCFVQDRSFRNKKRIPENEVKIQAAGDTNLLGTMASGPSSDPSSGMQLGDHSM